MRSSLVVSSPPALQRAISVALPADEERVPAWALAMSRLMMLCLRLGLARRLAARLVGYGFSRLGFADILVSASAPAHRRAFVSSLLATVREKLLRGELQSEPVARWVAALLVAAVAMPRRTSRFLRRHGFRPPSFLVVSATDRCNLACAHCYEESDARRRASLDFATFSRLVTLQREEWGAPMVVVTGGEPFLYAQGGRTLLTLARQHPRTLFVVYTNATVISDAVAQELRAVGNVVPLISLEGDEAQTAAVRGPRAWPAALAAMRRLRRLGLIFGVSVTASRANAELLRQPEYFRALRDEHGATFFWILERASLGRAAEAQGALLALEEKAGLQAALSELVTREGFLVVSFLHAPSAYSGCLGAGRTDAFFHVDASGDVKHCVYSPLRLGDVRALVSSGGALSEFLFTPAAKALRDAQARFFASDEPWRSHRPCPVIASTPER